MSTQQSFFIVLALLCLCALFFFLIFGEDGLAELRDLRQEKTLLLEKIEILNQQNLEKYLEIQRLENDLTYIGEIARKDLGMIKDGEVIIKPKKLSPSKTLTQDILQNPGQNGHEQR